MRTILRATAAFMVVAMTGGRAEAGAAAGPLSVFGPNPRYFTDGSGRAVYLTGSHTWESQQDLDTTDPPRAFDYTALLDMMEAHDQNFMRYWMYETALYAPWRDPGEAYYYDPLPWARPGPGTAADGKPKFDLATFNQDYFDRMRARVIAARDRGIYCAVMLFQGWSIEKKRGDTGGNPWLGHPFNAANNINSIDGDPNADDEGSEIHTLDIPAVTALQEAYVVKVIDTVNDLDNVLYEIANETHGDSYAWHNHMIDFIHDYETNNKPKQHMVGATVPYPGGDNTQLFALHADWVSPNGGGGYKDDPPAADGSKVILNDTDHLWGVGGNRGWVWMSACRGLNPLYMDCFDSHVLSTSAAAMDEMRTAMQYAKSYVDRMDLAQAVPQNALAASGYCLAKATANDGEYLVFIPAGGACDVDLSASVGTLTVEWFDPVNGVDSDGGTVTGGATRTLVPPFAGPAVVFLDGHTDYFKAEPETISPGGVAKLSWRVADATSVTLDGAAVNAEGSTYVSPSSTTTYALSAVTTGGTVDLTATVTVGAAAVVTTVEVDAGAARIVPGASVGLAARVLDQYGNPMTAPVTWMASTGGGVSPAGGSATVFTSAGTTATVTVTATALGVPGTADIEVTPIVLRVNCGPGTPAVAGWDVAGTRVTGGADYTFPGTADTTGVTGAAPVDVYKTCRHQNHSYDFDGVADGTYTLALHFYDEYAADGRAMDYTAEGVLVLDDFSIIAASGLGLAHVETFDVTVTGGDGLQIVADMGTGNDAFECGIELTAPVSGGPVADVTPPLVDIASPAADAVVDGVVEIAGTASDAGGLLAVEVCVDGGAYVPASGLAEWTLALNAADLADGPHAVTARAIDDTGNQAEVSVTIHARVAPASDGGGSGGCVACGSSAGVLALAILALAAVRRRRD